MPVGGETTDKSDRMNIFQKLPDPHHYFAPEKGVYNVSPGLSPLGYERLFQIDRTFCDYRANKMDCRRNRLKKHVLYDDRFDLSTSGTAARKMAARMIDEYPELFRLDVFQDGASALYCSLTGETLQFDSAMRIIGCEAENERADPPYLDAFDALCCQLQEDAAVVMLPDGAPDYNAALHICAPTLWIPEEKIGRSFLSTHSSIPHFDRVAQASGALLNKLLTGKPVTRLNWSLVFTEKLNLHPHCVGISAAELWRVMEEKKAFLRIERQGLWGMPEARAVLFTIRVYVTPVSELTREERLLLAAAMRSMSSETLSYKGLDDYSRDAVAFWLENNIHF